MNSHQYEAKVRKRVRKERPAPSSMGLTGTPIIIRWELEISMSSGIQEEAGGLRAALRAVAPCVWQFVLCTEIHW